MASNIFTIEGIIENGQVRLPTQIHLPEGARVFVIIPDVQVHEGARIFTPRLKNPSQASDFIMEVQVEPRNGTLR